MAFRAPLRRLAVTAPFTTARAFHSTPRALISSGDKIPKSTSLFENSATDRICLADEFSKAGDGYIIGVPGAFTGTCSSKHIPSYINSPKLKDAGQVFVVSVNDPFVMKAWAENLDPNGKSGIRFIADPTAAFIKELEMGYEGAAAVLGGLRSRRFVLKIRSGSVAKVFQEADPTDAKVTLADNVLG